MDPAVKWLASRGLRAVKPAPKVVGCVGACTFSLMLGASIVVGAMLGRTAQGPP
jgi:hypothetical protein